MEKSRDSGKPDLLSSEFTLSIFQKMEYTLDSWLGTIKPGIRAYMFKDDDRGEMHTTINKSDVDKVASFITYYDIPKNVVPKSGLAHMNILGLLVELDHYNLSPKSCQKIWEVAHSTMKPKKR